MLISSSTSLGTITNKQFKIKKESSSAKVIMRALLLSVLAIVASSTADRGRADTSDTKRAQRQQTTDHRSPKKIEFHKNLEHFTSFTKYGRITTHIHLADLVIQTSQEHFHEDLSLIEKHLGSVTNYIYNTSKSANLKGLSDRLNHEFTKARELIFINDHMTTELSRRGIWGPLALMTGLFTGGVSLAAMASAHNAQSDVDDLRQQTDKIFHVQSQAINDHAKIIEQIVDEQFKIRQSWSQIVIKQSCREIYDEIKELHEKIKDSNHVIRQLIAGNLPAQLINHAVVESTSALFKKIHARGFQTLEDLRPMDLARLPFSVAITGDGSFYLHIHIPIFKDRNHDILRLLQVNPLPWQIMDSLNRTVIAYPTDSDHFDMIAVPENDERTELHQLIRADRVNDCPRFRDIYLCQSTGIFNLHYSDSCIGAVYTAQIEAITKRCQLRPANFISFASKVNDTLYRLVLTESSTFRMKDIVPDTPTSIELEQGVYDVILPYNAWVKSTSIIIESSKTWADDMHIVSYVPRAIDRLWMDLRSLPEPFDPSLIPDVPVLPSSVPTLTPMTIIPRRHSDVLLIIFVILVIILFLGIGGFCVWADRKRRSLSREDGK